MNINQHILHPTPTGGESPSAVVKLLAEGAFLITMAIKHLCSYCGKENYSIKQRATNAWSVSRRLEIKWPVCSKCFSLIRKNVLPLGVAPSDFAVSGQLKEIQNIAHRLSKKTPLHEIFDLIKSVDGLSIFHHEAIQVFNQKAIEASEAAKKVEWTRRIVESAKSIIELKLSISYDFCRKAANRAISNPVIRKAVFERDGFECKICGSRDNLSVDHIKPVRFGGGDEMENFQTLCLPCNSSKGSKNHVC